MKGLATDKTYQELLAKIGDTFLISRQNAIKAINAELTKSNWETGKFIVEFEQDGNVKAKYGDELIKQLAKDWTCNKKVDKKLSYIFDSYYILKF